MTTNSGKVTKSFSCPLMNSSKGKYEQLEHKYRLKSTEGEETLNTFKVEISHSTLKVF